jgi:tetratricopeptide (TPR) repeat protein
VSESRPLRVFLASPGDVVVERNLVRSTIERYNNTRRAPGEREYTLVGWEETRGTARRPQDEINELISTCEFMIVLFKESWGSDPGSPFGYTSGTEEELFMGLLELGIAEQPMEDIWIAFLDSPAPARQITDLRTQLQRKNAGLYERLANDLDLDWKLSDRLAGWQKTAGNKTARQLDLVPESGHQVLVAAKLRHEGEALISLGQSDLGIEKLRLAAELDGPTEKIAYARALGRRGQFAEALEQANAAINVILADAIELNSTLAGEAFLAAAGILRRQGEDLQAADRLGSILMVLDHRASGAWRVRARILDERGLAFQRLGRIEEAKADLVQAYELREGKGSVLERAQSLVNLVRLAVGQHDLASAETYSKDLLDTLAGTSHSALHSNAWTAIAQLRLRQGSAAEGIEFASRALSLNEQTENRSGVAKSLLVLAQCSRSLGLYRDARVYAERCVEVNNAMGNSKGAQLAQWQLDQLPADKDSR